MLCILSSVCLVLLSNQFFILKRTGNVSWLTKVGFFHVKVDLNVFTLILNRPSL